ncbi:hypothetical protein J6X13_01455 [Candidatus Saccharibacteria bacterium]|nr:hypothetical protein [Candidatus Saccharibacteria bacterium]
MKKKKIALVAALFVFSAVALGLVAMVYAKYVSKIEKTGTATVAKWAFTTDNLAGSVVCELDETYDATTLVADRIAPGTSGKCPILVSNANSEVSIRYDIKPSTVANQPKNLKFYKEAAHTNEITGTTTINGTLAPGAAATTVYVYWQWPYQDGTEEYDADDTTDGENANTMTMTFDVVGTQIQPVAQ